MNGAVILCSLASILMAALAGGAIAADKPDAFVIASTFSACEAILAAISWRDTRTHVNA